MRMRLVFGLIGALACLAAALIAELLFLPTKLTQSLENLATHVLIYRSEIENRLERAGAGSGDIELTLTWNNRNDLDLHCIDPHGVEISYQNTYSPEGGHLDVDANSEFQISRPVEHIRWPYGHAIPGHYTVKVQYFRNHGGPDPTPFSVQVREHGIVRHFSGSLYPIQEKTVDQFILSPSQGIWVGWLSSLLMAALVTGLWCGLLSISLALALILAQQWFVKRRYGAPLIPWRRVRSIVFCGLIAGLVAGVIGQSIYTLLEMRGWLSPVVEREIGWVVLGGIMGRGIAVRMPNLPRRAAMHAGMFGGLFGVYSFLSTFNTGSDLIGRVTAAAGIGFLIGLMIRLVLEPIEEPHTLYTTSVMLEPMRLRANRTGVAGTIRPPNNRE